MKLYQVVLAVPALNKLSVCDMPLCDAYNLQRLYAAIQPDIDFFNAQNQRIAKKYNGVISDNGTIVYDVNNQADAQKEFDELLYFDVRAEVTPVKLQASNNISLSAKDVAALIPFVEFLNI